MADPEGQEDPHLGPVGTNTRPDARIRQEVQRTVQEAGHLGQPMPPRQDLTVEKLDLEPVLHAYNFTHTNLA